MLSMGLGTFETIGKLFTSALEKDKVHEWKEELGEREKTWTEGGKGADR